MRMTNDVTQEEIAAYLNRYNDDAEWEARQNEQYMAKVFWRMVMGILITVFFLLMGAMIWAFAAEAVDKTDRMHAISEEYGISFLSPSEFVLGSVSLAQVQRGDTVLWCEILDEGVSAVVTCDLPEGKTVIIPL
jgi:hypothetical protein